jgi:hypothetical protein
MHYGAGPRVHEENGTSLGMPVAVNLHQRFGGFAVPRELVVCPLRWISWIIGCSLGSVIADGSIKK